MTNSNIEDGASQAARDHDMSVDPLRARARESLDDPHRLARSFVNANFVVSGPCLLRQYQNDIFEWVGPWRRVSESDIHQQLVRHVKNTFDAACANPSTAAETVAKKVKRSLIQDAFTALRSLIGLPSDITIPYFINGSSTGLSEEESIVFRNGIVYPKRLFINQPCFIALNANIFTPFTLGVDFDSDSPEPTAWLGFLESVFGNDFESIYALQEFFGYTLSTDCSLQKALMLLGPKRAGKGTITDILSAILGAQNCVAPTLKSFSTQFGLEPLLDKFAITIRDARIDSRSDINTIVERILSLTGGDHIAVDRKYKSAVNSRFFGKIILLSNEIPRLDDASSAVQSRFIIIRCTQSFLGREDTKLFEKLRAELPSIALWALAGLQRLRERGHFVQPQSANALIETMQELSSPISEFIAEKCIVEPSAQVAVQELYSGYRNWLEARGQKFPATVQSFGRDLHAALPTLGRLRLGSPTERTRFFTGIGLKKERFSPRTYFERSAQ